MLEVEVLDEVESFWKEEQVPTEWKEGHLIKLPQKR